MFNDLTGATQYVGNWPGVTVERRKASSRAKEVLITDLPGIYSSLRTRWRRSLRDYLVNEKLQAIMNLVDAFQHRARNLYLTTQLLEMGIPVVAALNMMDIVKKRGDVGST